MIRADRTQVEMYDTTDERFVPLNQTRLEELTSVKPEAEAADGETGNDEASSTIPPLHQQSARTLTVWLNKNRPLSEPKWVKGNNADEWLFEMFGSYLRPAADVSTSGAIAAWRGKLEVVDPDPAPTLSDILTSWSNTSSAGSSKARIAFTTSLLADPNDLLEILLRLARGDRNPTIGGSGGTNQGFGSLVSAIRPDSPYASHQTHVSLAILQMYRLTMAYASMALAKQGEDEVREKVEDIVKSLPVGMIQKSLDGLFKEWSDRRD